MQNSSIELKSSQYVLTLVMDPSVPFEKILADVKEKFTSSARFFRGAQMALEFKGRLLPEQEQSAVAYAITQSCGLDIICILEKDEELEAARQMIIREQRARIHAYIQLDQTELRIAKGTGVQLSATVEDLLDDYLGYRIRAELFHSQSNQRIHGAKRTLMMQILQDAGCGSSSSDDLCQIALEDIIDDIGEIIDLSSDTGEAKMKRKIRKVRSAKGRIKKIKKGILEKKKKKPIMTKKKKTRRKTTRRRKKSTINSENNI